MAQPEKYSKVQIALHWGIAGLMVISFFSSDAMSAAWRALMKTGTVEPTLGVRVHVVIGALVLALVVLRLVMRKVQGVPDPIKTGKPLQDRLAQVIHIGLYLCMLAIPVAGLSAWFGGVKLAAEAHEVLFNIGIAFVILHVAAALMHQFVLKDNLMARMK
ncbi:Cytochrome b-562 [Thalassovita gelatinovora]|uniref:Cytochrome b-562 n=1 Tax=Thalassovita gelatinovora TaxID=53501 RepID=A0A0P1FKF4_THAGE|nr:cytochrome b/b6 domain-containing protein [Thalassovita gelatinovora]QIZ81522.1 cytochrome B [Thalassovita gelatinovora]CUH67903.1 Cytochrome b-562 [Thalassovita gelatinovora]SEQ25204.1 cytochrome b561 [Thalassovita gelatinovora]